MNPDFIFSTERQHKLGERGIVFIATVIIGRNHLALENEFHKSIEIRAAQSDIDNLAGFADK